MATSQFLLHLPAGAAAPLGGLAGATLLALVCWWVSPGGARRRFLADLRLGSHRAAIASALQRTGALPSAYRSGAAEPWLQVGRHLVNAGAEAAARAWFERVPRDGARGPWDPLEPAQLLDGERVVPVVIASRSPQRITVLPLAPVRLATGRRVWLNVPSGERQEARVRDGAGESRGGLVQLSVGPAAGRRQQRQDVRVATAEEGVLYADTTTIRNLDAARRAGRSADVRRLAARLREEMDGHPGTTVRLRELSLGGASLETAAPLFARGARAWVWIPAQPEAGLGDALLPFEVLEVTGADPSRARVRFLSLGAAERAANRQRVAYWERQGRHPA